MGFLSKYIKLGRAGFSHHFLLPVLAVLAVGAIGVVTLRLSSAKLPPSAFQTQKYCQLNGYTWSSSNKVCYKSGSSSSSSTSSCTISGKSCSSYCASIGKTWSGVHPSKGTACISKSSSSSSTPKCGIGEYLTTTTSGAKVCMKNKPTFTR